MGSMVWDHINKTWKVMIDYTYQLSLRTQMELLHSNIRWFDGKKSLTMDLPKPNAWTFTASKSSALKMCGIVNNGAFLHG